MSRRILSAAVAVLALAAVSPATAGTTHTLIVAVEKTLPPAAEKKLAVLVLISQRGVAPAGAVATAAKPLRVVQANGGLYRVKAEIDGPCTGSCAASYRIAGSADHELRIIPLCRLRRSGFVCSKLKIVKVY
jgi:hypothetical protein